MADAAFRLRRFLKAARGLPRQIGRDVALHRRVAHDTGAGTSQMAADILRQVRLLFARRITAADYYYYDLRVGRAPIERALSFTGLYRDHRVHRERHGPGYAALFQDKYVQGVWLGAAGLPAAPILAVTDRPAAAPGIAALADWPAFEAWLRASPGDIVIKPVSGAAGIGLLSLGERLPGAEPAWRRVPQGAPVALAELRTVFEARLRAHRLAAPGLIVQPRLRPHADLARYAPEVAQCVRVLTLCVEGRAEVARAMQRISLGRFAADNVSLADRMVAPIELETGRLSAAALAGDVPVSFHDTHPVTGAPIAGETAPLWPEIKAIALEAARHMPQSEIVGWDIAATTEGAFLIEGNMRPNFRGSQLGRPWGMLADPRIGPWMRSRGLDRALPIRPW